MKWHLFRLVVLNKAVVQQYSLETLHNNRNYLKRKDLSEVTMQTLRLPRLLNKKDVRRLFLHWVESFYRHWIELRYYKLS